MIQANSAADEIDKKIDGILDLAAAKKVVPEFGTVAAMILAVAIISIVAVSARSKHSLILRV